MRAAPDFEGEIGKRLALGPVPVRFEAMAEYTRSVSEPGYERNIHTDPDYARRYGFDRPIAEGRMWVTLLSALLGSALGPAWLAGGSLAATFLKPVKPGDTITAHANATASRVGEDGRRLELEVWCTNQHAEKVMAGTASWVEARSAALPIDRGGR